VVEDAPAGIEAGLAAGMYVVAIATTFPPGALTRAHRLVSRLAELDGARSLRR
jgi:sugar-phosphatase